jgi:hypothetical protein
MAPKEKLNCMTVPLARKPPEEFLLQFNALGQLDDEEKKVARALLDGLVLRHQAKKLMNQKQAM